jgi:hypothetical protein
MGPLIVLGESGWLAIEKESERFNLNPHHHKVGLNIYALKRVESGD